MGSRDEGELVPKLVWRVKLVAEFGAGASTEVEVARLERDEQAGLADLGLCLAEAKQLMAAIQAEIVPVQVTVAGEHRRAGQQGTLHRGIPLAVRRRANPGSALAYLSLPGDGRSKELRRFQPRGRDRGARTGVCDGAVCGAGAVRQGRRPTVGIASDQRGTERGHGAKPDDAGRRGGCAAARRENGRGGDGTAGQTRRDWA